MFDAWLAEVPQVVRGWELEPVSFELAVPGEHNRRNAATALAALELAGVERADAEPVLARFRGAGRRFELVGEKNGVTVVDDYAHTWPTRFASRWLRRADSTLVAPGNSMLRARRLSMCRRMREHRVMLAASRWPLACANDLAAAA